MSDIIYEVQDWNLVEKQPTIPAYTPQEVFTIEQIDENLSQWTITAQQAIDTRDIWQTRKDKAEELNISRQTESQ